MITITIALSFNYAIFFQDTKYMTILTRQEKERLVLDLYNQGKTYREIAKGARISPRDIGIIVNKVVEEKTKGLKEEQQLEVEHLSLSTQAYKLFSEDKSPIEVAIALNLGEAEATKFYKEYWKLKQLHNLNMVYEEIKDDIRYFAKLYKLAKVKGMGVQQVVDLLKIANNDLPAIEEQFKKLRDDVNMLQSQKCLYERNLYQWNNQITTTSRVLSSLHISCERQRRDIENLYNERARLESVVTKFKSNNEEYLNIKQVAEEYMKSVLTNGKLLLKFAVASVIESLRRNPDLYNDFVLYNTSNNNNSNIASYGSNNIPLMSEEDLFSYINNDPYIAVILEEAEKLYNKLTIKLTNSVIEAAADN